MDVKPVPAFCIHASDQNAAALVNLWAAMERMRGADAAASPEEITAAEALANDMVRWRGAVGLCEPAGIRTLAEGLALLAELCGAVVTVTQQPLQPLAQGNYVHAVSVRLKNWREGAPSHV